MNRKTSATIVAWLIGLLLALEGVYCFAVARSYASLFRGAQNVRPSDPLPVLVWQYVATGCLWFGAGTVYLLDIAGIRRWSIIMAVPALFYGIHGYKQISPVLLSWFGLFHGDLVALGAASAAVFCLLGGLGILYQVIVRKAAGIAG